MSTGPATGDNRAGNAANQDNLLILGLPSSSGDTLPNSCLFWSAGRNWLCRRLARASPSLAAGDCPETRPGLPRRWATAEHVARCCHDCAPTAAECQGVVGCQSSVVSCWWFAGTGKWRDGEQAKGLFAWIIHGGGQSARIAKHQAEAQAGVSHCPSLTCALPVPRLRLRCHSLACALAVPRLRFGLVVRHTVDFGFHRGWFGVVADKDASNHGGWGVKKICCETEC